MSIFRTTSARMDPKRLFFGVILPIPLYCIGSAIFSFRGLIRNPEDFAMLALLWVGYGILIMGIPSILYSVAIEYLRVKENLPLGICSVFGAVLGFISGSVFFFLYSDSIVFYTMSLPGAVIGGIIPLIISRIMKRENKAEMATPRKPYVYFGH